MYYPLKLVIKLTEILNVGTTRYTMKITIAFTAAALICSSLNALELKQMVQETVQTNPKIQKQLSAHKAVQEDLNSAKAGWYPKLDLVAKVGPEYANTPNLTDSEAGVLARTELGLTLQENLFEGFATQEGINEQRARVNSTAYATLDEANKLSLSAITSYVNYIKAKQLLDLEETNVQTHMNILKKTKEKTSAGLGKRSDVEQTQGRLALANSNYYSQKNNFLDAQSTFERVYGHFVEVDELIDLEMPIFDALEFAQLDAQADEFNPALQILQENINAQNSVYERSRATFYPTVDAVASVSDNYNIHGIEGEDQTASLMFNLNYNLYNGGSDEAQRVKNQLLITKERSALNDVSRDVTKELRLALNANNILTEQIKYLKQHSEYTLKTANSYQQEFNLGRRTLLDLLNSKLEYNNAQKTQEAAKFDLILAKYRILSVTGQLLETMDVDVANKVTLYSNDVEEELEEDETEEDQEMEATDEVLEEETAELQTPSEPNE